MTGEVTGEVSGAGFLKEEYQVLRGEILKRTELQHQLISIALLAFGSLLALGFGKDGSPQATLAYPLLTVALAAAWSQHDIRIRQIGEYIRDNIEPQCLGPSLTVADQALHACAPVYVISIAHLTYSRYVT